MNTWGYPIATLPATNGTIRRYIRRMNANSASHCPNQRITTILLGFTRAILCSLSSASARS
eukprot:6193987-Pleurochrysis_carterae.AAC.3